MSSFKQLGPAGAKVFISPHYPTYLFVYLFIFLIVLPQKGNRNRLLLINKEEQNGEEAIKQPKMRKKFAGGTMKRAVAKKAIVLWIVKMKSR